MNKDRSKSVLDMESFVSGANGTSIAAFGLDLEQSKFVREVHRRMRAANEQYRDEFKQQ